MSWKNDINRFRNLEKIASLESAMLTIYLGSKINNVATNIGDSDGLLEAAYDVSESGHTIDEEIDIASRNKYIGATLASLATALALKTKLPLKATIPTALVSLGMANSYNNKENLLKKLKGKKLMLNDYKDLK